MDPTTSLKAYWSILKTFLNNKKMPCIPPVYHNNNHITNFKENFSPIPLKEYLLSTIRLLKFVCKTIRLQKSLKILIRIKPMALT